MKARFMSGGLILAMIGLGLYFVHGHRDNYFMPMTDGLVIMIYGLLSR